MITVTGNFESLTGVGNGYVVFTLINYGSGNVPRLSGTGVIVNPSLTTLAGTSFSVQLWGNDVITPTNTYYQVSFYDTGNNLISSATYQFTGSGSYDLSSTTPVVVTPTMPVGLASVSYSGSYIDLSNKPTSTTNTWTATQTFNATVALGASNVLQLGSDTGISRTAAGVVGIGNGTAADASGTLNVASLYTSSLRPQSTLLTYTYADLGANRNLIPLVLGQWADRFQFATITALETSTNGSTWSDWSAQINSAKPLFSGYYNNAGFSINPTTYPYWRITLNTGQFSYGAMLELVQEYSTGGTKPFTVTLETSSDGASWSNVIGPTSVSAANPDYAHLFFASQTANSYFRVTIQHTSTASNYNWKAIRLRSTRTNGQGGQVQGLPFSWDANGTLKTVSSASLQIGNSSGVLQFWNGSAFDTGISRTAAGVIGIGNGTAGDVSGGVSAAAYYGNNFYVKSNAGIVQFYSGSAYDLGLSRGAAGQLNIGNGTASDASGYVNAAGYKVNGAALNFTDLAGTLQMSEIPTGGSSSTYLRGDGVWATPSGSGMTNPMTTIGDLIYASASGSPATPARLAGNTTTGTYFLGSTGNGSTAQAPTWFTSTGTGSVVRATSPTLTTPNIGAATATTINSTSIPSSATLMTTGTAVQASQLPAATTAALGAVHLPSVTVYTTGSGTYTTPAGATMLHVRLIGGGGGGSGSGTSNGGGGTSGGNTTFGSSFLTGGGGGVGVWGSNGGGGGTATGGTINIAGGGGGMVNISFSNCAAGQGASSPFGSAAAAKGSTANNSAVYGTGGTGAGAGGTTATSGAGGGAGGYVEAWVTSPSATYSYAVGGSGGGGTAGTSGFTGGNGAPGVIIIEAY